VTKLNEMKHLLTLAALLFSLAITTRAQENLMYQLVVETEAAIMDSCYLPENNIGEVLIHRLYVEAQSSTDILSAVFGDDDDPLVVTAPGGVFSFEDAGSWNASIIHPALVEFGLCLNFDSYATIGLDGPSDFQPGSSDPSLVDDYTLSPTVSEFFTNNTFGEYAELNVNTPNGASWFIISNPSNALPDEDGRWLVMQLTSEAHVEGVLNFQIFPLGVNSDAIYVTRTFNTASLCTDPYACNYEPSAFNDQGLCDYSCCPGPGCCGEGTTWDSESQTCLTTYLHDADFDGCVGMTDLLDLLSVFGTCLEE